MEVTLLSAREADCNCSNNCGWSTSRADGRSEERLTVSTLSATVVEALVRVCEFSFVDRFDTAA